MNLSRSLDAVTKARRRLRGFRLSCWIRVWGGSVGHRLEVERGVHLRHAPSRRWRIGDDVYLGVGAVLDVRHGATLVLKDRAKVMHHVVIAAYERIEIGIGAQIAELSSVRDMDHGRAPGVPVRDQPVLTGPVRIGDDVWVGRGVAILRGSEIGDSAVIGANAVVHRPVPPRSTAVGVPARTLPPQAMT